MFFRKMKNYVTNKDLKLFIFFYYIITTYKGLKVEKWTKEFDLQERIYLH